jgi:hypothetical protein
MGRIFLIAALVYGYGDAGFDGHRPASLDRGMREFHRAVDTAAAQTQRALIAIDDGRRVITTLPQLASKLRSLGEALAPI